MAKDVNWTQKLIERFIVIALDQTLSYGDMAKILSREFRIRLTRNACIGKARRLGFEPRRDHHRGGIKLGSHQARPRIKKVPLQVIEVPPPLQKVAPKTRPANGMLLEHLELGDCKWPLNEGGPFRFCGHQQVENSPYCSAHTLRAFNGAYARRRAVGVV